MPMSRRAGGSAVISTPSTRTVPASGVSKPATTLSRVVLPDPLGPRIVRSSPSLTASDTPSSANTSPKRLVTPSTLSSAVRAVSRSATPYAFFSIQAFHSSMALLPFSAYHSSLIQNCLSTYCVGR